MVEHTAENRGVAGSIPALATRLCRLPVRFAPVTTQENARPVAVIGAALDLGAGRRGVDMGPSAIRYAGLDARIERARPASASTSATSRPRLPEAAPVGDERTRYLKEITPPARASPTWLSGAEAADACRSSSAATTRSRSGRSAASREPHGPGGVLWVDAHGDLNRPETSPSGNVHGMALAAALGLAGPAFESEACRLPVGRPEPRRARRRARRSTTGERDLLRRAEGDACSR